MQIATSAVLTHGPKTPGRLVLTSAANIAFRQWQTLALSKSIALTNGLQPTTPYYALQPHLEVGLVVVVEALSLPRVYGCCSGVRRVQVRVEALALSEAQEDGRQRRIPGGGQRMLAEQQEVSNS